MKKIEEKETLGRRRGRDFALLLCIVIVWRLWSLYRMSSTNGYLSSS